MSAFLQAADPLPAIAGSRRPLLVVSSRNDPVFPELTAEELHREARGHRSTLVVPTDAGGHIGHMGLYPEWTAELLHRFFGLAGGVASTDSVRRVSASALRRARDTFE